MAAGANYFDKDYALHLRDEAERQAGQPDVQWLPPDELFANDEGAVNEAEVPDVFPGTILAGRYRIVSYIQSGQFGRGAHTPGAVTGWWELGARR